ncbi:MAG: AAA family ATPase [Saprospiraceae bacterium]|jgi:shikimate kinase|nr:AAA family ATPase [Saprospiraceae bacterium]
MVTMRIFLTGFMGSGKTTVGTELAQLMSYPFIDLDEQLVIGRGMPIATQFKVYGEEVFRQKEREVLRQTAVYAHAVIACGGGAPCYYDNMDWMNRHGITVFLHIPPEKLVSRLQSEKVQRPLLQNLSDEELLLFITNKLQERMPYYEQASITADATLPVKILCAQILHQLNQFNSR